MTFAYIIKQVFQQWVNSVAKNQLAQTLVVHESPSIEMAKQIKQFCCPAKQDQKGSHE